MSDIQVSSEITSDRSDWLADLRAAEQDAQSFVQRIQAMHAELPVTVNLTGATTSLEAFIKQAQANGINIPVTFTPSGGAAPGGTAVQAEAAAASQVQPYGVVESGPYALAPKAEISQNFARITATRNLIEEEIEGVEVAAAQAGAIAGEVERAAANARSRSPGGREADGFSEGTRSRIGNGLYRYLSIAFAAREVIGSAIDARQLGIEEQLAGNDVGKQYEAQESFIKKFGFTNLLLDPTGSQQIERQRVVESAQFGEEFAKRRLDLSQATSRAQREAAIADTGGLDRERLEAENRYTEESIRIENERRNDPQRAKINEEATRRLSQAEAERQTAIGAAGGSNLAGQISSGLRDSSGTEERNKLVAAIDAANKAYEETVAAIEKDRQQRNAALDAQLQKQLDAARQIRDITIARAEAAQDRLTAESDIRVRSIEGERSDIRTRQTGFSADAEKTSFARKLNDETDALNARRAEALAKGDFAEAGRLTNQIATLEAARPERVAENNRRIDQEQVKLNRINQIETADIGAAANEAALRGQGREREAAQAELNRSIDDRVAKLRAESDALKGVDNAESQRLANLAKATEASKQQVTAAQQAGFQRETQNNLADIAEATAEALLSAQGQRYQSGERAADARFNREARGLRQAGRDEEAAAVEQERDAARAARQALRAEDVRRIGASAQQQHLRNEFRDPEADLQRLNEQHQEEIFNAGGDPEKIAGLNQLHQERLRNFVRQTVTGVTQTSARSIYFNAQAAILGDPTGREAASRAAANAQARRELEHARPAPPPSLIKWNQMHGGAAMDEHGHPVSDKNKNAGALADLVKKGEEIVKEFKDAVDLMVAEAV